MCVGIPMKLVEVQGELGVVEEAGKKKCQEILILSPVSASLVIVSW